MGDQQAKNNLRQLPGDWAEQVELEIEESEDDASDPEGEEEPEEPFVEVVSKKRCCRHTREERKAVAEKRARQKRAEEYKARQLLQVNVDKEAMSAFISVITAGMKGGDAWREMNKAVERLGGCLYQRKRCAGRDVYAVDLAEKEKIIRTL